MSKTEGTCDAGECLLTLATCQTPYAITVDGTHVYWTDQTPPGRAVRKVSLGGGDVTTLATGESNLWAGIAVNSGAVFWTDPGGGTVNSVPLAGGTVTALVSGQSNPSFLAVDEENVYWTNLGTFANSYQDGSVMTVPVRGGTPTVLASRVSCPKAITIDAANVYWGSGGCPQIGGAQDTVTQLSRATGSAIALFVGPPGYGSLGLASDGTSVYWTDEYYGFVLKAPVGGGGLTMLASDQDAPATLVVDATSVYWYNLNTGSVTMVPLGGGPPVTLVPGVAGYTAGSLGLAIDGTSLYWGLGAIRKLTPK